jgi:type II secretory pathway pseudopilin PulG
MEPVKRNVLQDGFTLAGALVLIAIMSIMLALAVPLWSRIKQRDNEEELIFRGEEYTEAIGRYQAKFHTFPPDLETLYKLKFIRKLYKDPMTKTGKWKLLHPESLVQTGAAGTIGSSQSGTDQFNQDQNRDEGNDEGGDESNQRGENRHAGNRKHKEDDSQNLDEDDKNSDEEKEVESNGPVVGVVSRSKKSGMKLYKGQSNYNRWIFVYALQQKQQTPPPPPGQPGRPGQQPPGNNPPKPGTSPPPAPPQPPDEQDDNP